MPKKVRTVKRGIAWWYAEKNAIELYACPPSDQTMVVRLPISTLREFVRRADAKENRK
jgi:hypothetical protein